MTPSVSSQKLKPLRGWLLAVLLIGQDDLCDQWVAHDVGLAELYEPDALDVLQDRPSDVQAAADRTGQVGLGDVARHYYFAVEAHAGEEHLHLLGGGVLSLVEDYEGVVEGAAAHEGQRRHLDGALLHEPLGTLGGQHVVKGVVQRP